MTAAYQYLEGGTLSVRESFDGPSRGRASTLRSNRMPQEIGWRLGEERILLTIGGLALAILFSLRLP